MNIKTLPGLALCSTIGFLSFIISKYFLKQFEAITISLLIGALVSQFFVSQKTVKPGVNFAAKTLLNIAIIGLGLTIDLKNFLHLGLHSLIILSSMVVIVILMSLLLARVFAIRTPVALLIAFGSGICGTAAIAATSHLITDKEEDLGTATAVIHFIGLLTLFLLPVALSLTIDLPKNLAAFLIGGSMQALGHVIAASYLLDEAPAKLAITIKMARVSLLIPLILGLSIWSSRTKKRNTQESSSLIYIYGFMGSVAVASMELIPKDILGFINSSIKVILLVSMAAIGIKMNPIKSLPVAGKGFVLGLIIFVFQIFFLYYSQRIISLGFIDN